MKPHTLSEILLVNGIKEVANEDTDIEEYVRGGAGWAAYLATNLGSTGFVKALTNYETAFIDPMTAEILRDMGIEDDYVGLLLYANSLMDDEDFKEANDLSNYRIRGPELIPAILHKTLHKDLEAVRATAGSVHPHQINMATNAIISQLMVASNVEEVAELNPLLSAEALAKATWVGPTGLGDSMMVKQSMRATDPTFKGVFGYYSPDSEKVGVNRSLTYGTIVRGRRGMLHSAEANSPAELLSLGELVQPFTARHADPPRIGMNSKQATHSLPIRGASPNLVVTGVERSLGYIVPKTFAYRARAPGKIISIDEKAQVMRLGYDDGKEAVVDLSARSIKNSGGG